MAKKESLKVIVTLTGDALGLVKDTQKSYTKKKQIRGKNKIINLLLVQHAQCKRTI